MRAMRHSLRAVLVPVLPLLTVGSLLLGASSCTSTPYLEPDPYATEERLEPDWRWMPHSWEKLGAIETWLVGAGPRIHPELVAEAELLLAEGRLRFAHEEADVLPAGTLRTRVSAAESGLRRVLSDPFADESIKSRARRALADLEGVRRGSDVAQVSGVLPRSAWSARRENRRRLTPTNGRWRRITVHHSANEAISLRGAAQSASGETIAGIQEFHMNSRGWGDIGYHFLIDPQGRIFAGRSLQWQGAHAGGVDGVNNIENIGICLLGNFQEERPSAQSVASLQGLLDNLRKRFGIPLGAVHGHQLYKSTACPGRYLQPWVEAYRRGKGASGAWPVGRTERVAEAAPNATVAARPLERTTRRRAGDGRVR